MIKNGSVAENASHFAFGLAEANGSQASLIKSNPTDATTPNQRYWLRQTNMILQGCPD